MCANWSSWLGGADRARRADVEDDDRGPTTAAAARSRPQHARRRRSSSSPAAPAAAPWSPAETAASARPSCTSRMQVTTDASSRSRAARAGSSSCEITYGACTTSISGSLRTSGSSSGAGPQSKMRSPPFWTASRAPATIASGPWSLPIASSATVTEAFTPRAARSRAPCTSCTSGTSGGREWANRTASRRRPRSRSARPGSGACRVGISRSSSSEPAFAEA